MTPPPLPLFLNGEAYRFAPAAGSLPSVAALLSSLTPPPPARGLAVAVNGALVPRRTWESHQLAAGDTVEIVKALQGG